MDTGNGIAGSYRSSIFNFLRKLHTVFHSDHIMLHYYQQWTRDSNFSTTSPTLAVIFFFFFFMIAILADVKWYLILVLICISLVINAVKHLFMYLLAKYMSTLEKCLSKIFFVCLFFCFLGPHLHHVEVPRLGVISELQLLAYATATATWVSSCLCNLHHSSWQHRILNLLIEARDWTCILMVPSRVP